MRPGQELADLGALNELINLWGWLDETTYLTKTGGLGVVYRLAGVDYEGLEPHDCEQIVHRFLVALRPFDERFRVWQYLLKRRVDPFDVSPCGHPVAADAMRRRAAYLNSRRASLYLLDLYLVVELDGPTPRTSTPRSLTSETVFLGSELDRHVTQLHRAARSFEVSLSDVIRPSRLEKRHAFAFLQRLVNFDPAALDAPLVADEHLDYYLGNSAVRYQRDHIQVGQSTVKVLTMKAAPPATFAHLLRDLDRIPGQFLACLYWRPRPSGPVRTHLWWLDKYYQVKRGPSAEASRTQVGDVLRDMEQDGRVIGHCSLTLIIHDQAPAVVDDVAATAMKVFAAHDALLVEETVGSACAWLATIPGNAALNVRAPHLQVTDVNLADLSFIFTLDRGSLRNAHLDAAYLAAFETSQDTPYFYNLHAGDVGHTLILGHTGSGKSFLTGFLLMHAQQYDPFTVVIDVGGGYRKIAEALGGRYLTLGLAPTVSINPFALPDTPRHRHFLHGFVKVLLEGIDRAMPLSEREDRLLYQQISTVYALDPALRRLDAVSLPTTLQRRLAKWTEGGRFPLFDHHEDTFTLDRFQVLDLTAMRSYPEILQPMLFYVLHRIRERIGHGFTQIYLDEAWRTITHPVIADYVRDLIKTGRKDNAALVLITHSLEDLEPSGLLPDVLQGCHTKLICADQGFDRRLYAERLHLRETQLDLITQLIPKQQVYLMREGPPRVDKVLTLHVDPESARLYTHDGLSKDHPR